MPSPFLGMDPFLEAPDLWVDFHGSLAGEVKVQLNAVLPAPYYARLTPYVTYEVITLDLPYGSVRGVRPDVAVAYSDTARASAAAFETIVPAPVIALAPVEVPLTLYHVEILVTPGPRVVTAIEVLSPINKRAGHEAHGEYLRKRRELLRTEIHLIEIDLLRGGLRPPLVSAVPSAPYYVTLSRGDQRPRVEVWPMQLGERLPVVPVPLLSGDADVPLDLQKAVATVYTQGAYERQITYHFPPPVPELNEAQAAFVQAVLQAQAR